MPRILFRSLSAAVVCVLLMGCYTLEPVRGIAPEPGSQIALDINDAGRVALGGSMGVGILRAEGRLIQKDATAYVMSIRSISLLSGGEQSWSGERVRINTEYVSTVYERQFSKGKSVALVAVIGVGVGAIIAGRGIVGSTPNEIPVPIGPDTSHTLRRPARP